jgi:V/A-type H+-transporting ATPase subunit I
MAVAKMRRISLVGLIRDKAEIIERLQKLGTVHVPGYEEKRRQAESDAETRAAAEGISDFVFDGDGIVDTDTLIKNDPDFRKHEEQRKKLKTCIEELAPFDTRKKSLFSFLRPVSSADVAEVIGRADEILAAADRIVETDSGIRQAEEENARTRALLTSMLPWKDYPYVPSDSDTVFTHTEFLSADSKKDLEKLTEELSENAPSADVWEVGNSGENRFFVVTSLKSDRAAVDRTVSQNRVFRYDFSDVGSTFDDQIDGLLTRIDDVEARKNELVEFRKSSAEHLSDFEILYDSIGIETEKMIADANMDDSYVTFNFEGWVPAKAEAAVSRELSDNYICHATFRDPEENELPPTKLENGFLGASVEPVESLYSLLKYGEVDPSAISAFFYALFFGFMFSDAGYGIMLTVACAIILIKCKLKENMKKYIVLFLLSGISTIFWGVIFGSWFGNLVETVTIGKFALKPLWFDPQDGANTEHFLAFTLLLGVIHLYCAMLMKAVNLISKGKWIDAICDVFFWYIFYTGEILFLLPYIPYYSDTAFCANFSKYGIYLLGIGFVLILFTKGRKSKNPFMKIFGGITCLYSLVDMLSDCLSYTRLMAMGLATSVIINVFNSIGASAAGFATVGITFRLVIFIIIFVAANLFNFAINALGAYVNACRLTYIEFFGKFYEGDGLEYSPLRYNTEYILIEDGGADAAGRKEKT